MSRKGGVMGGVCVFSLFLFLGRGGVAELRKNAKPSNGNGVPPARSGYGCHNCGNFIVSKIYINKQYHDVQRDAPVGGYYTQLILLQISFQYEYPLSIPRGRKFLWP